MRAFFLLIASSGLAFALLYAAAAGEVSEEALKALRELPTGELVQRLADEKTIGPAFYEFERRAKGASSYAEFTADHATPEVIVCPQPGGAAPLFLVTWDFLARLRAPAEDFAPSDARKLFGAARRPAGVKVAFKVIGSDGREIAIPFNNNCQEGGTFADLNADGVIDRAEVFPVGLESGASARVLLVEPIRDPIQPIFAVVFEWGDTFRVDWGFRVADDDGDGLYDIQLGPLGGGSIEPKVTYRWSRELAKFTGPAGSAGEHFRVIDASNIFAETGPLEAEGTVFPCVGSKGSFDNRGEQGRRRGDASPAKAAVPPEVGPARSHPPRDLADADLVRFMAPGKGPADLEAPPPSRGVAEGFWSIPPKQAALTYALAVRSEDHRASLQLAIDDLDRAEAPESGTVAFRFESSGCYQKVETSWLLRFGASDCDLIAATSSVRGVVGRSIFDLPEYSIRRAALTAEEARHVAHVIFWLRRIRSQALQETDRGFMGSTADGHGEVTLVADGRVSARGAGTIWAGSASERWTGHWDETAFVNLAGNLFFEALPERLGARLPALDTEKATPPSEIAAALRDPVPEAGAAAADIVQRAADLAGTMGLRTLEPRLAALHAGWPERVREAANMARRKLAVRDEPDGLESWARSREPGFRWAAARLKDVNPARYASVLSSWLESEEDGAPRRQVLEEIRRVDAGRALAAAERVAPSSTADLALTAFEILEEAGATADVEARVGALTRIARDRSIGWDLRVRAIESLVPLEEPLRYTDPRVDSTLLELLALDASERTLDFTLPAACRALALRGRADAFAPMRERLDKGLHTYVGEQVVSALAYLVQRTRSERRADLAAALRPHLVKTNLQITKVLFAIWAADLRSLAPDLERIATSSPEEREGRKAYVSGSEPSPVNERYHAARQILALWREEQPATRARLLVAFGIENRFIATQRGGTSDTALRFETEIAAVGAALSAEDREQLDRFLSWYSTEAVASGATGAPGAFLEESLRRIRAGVGRAR